MTRWLSLWLLLAAPALATLPTPLTIPSLQQSMTVTALSSITSPTNSNPVQVDAFPYLTIQVNNETGTCSSLSISVIGSNDGTNWAPIPINGGNSTILQGDVPTSSTRAWSIPAGFKYVEANATTVTSCQVTVIFQANR
jgi:hypothetical protein